MGSRLTETEGRPSGFDYLRIVLATLIIADHAVIACLGMGVQRTLFSGLARPFFVAFVPMFFSLSGFLVASSLERSWSLITFVGLRILRIVPALAVDTLFCALLVGVVLTSLSLRNYFVSPDFYKYFLNIVGDIHYTLPGVFSRNPSNVVNAQLWTIPYELKCYAAVSALALLGLHRRPFLLLIATVTIVIATMIWVTLNPVEIVDVWQLLVPTFLLSVCAYLYRDRLPCNPLLCALSIVLAAALASQTGALLILAAVPYTYLTVWLGLLNPKRDPLIRSGDYSYPLYLYSFPIQQTLIALVPLAHIWWANFLLALPFTFILAAFSWHMIEKPAQSKRHYLYSFEAWLRRRRDKSVA